MLRNHVILLLLCGSVATGAVGCAGQAAERHPPEKGALGNKILKLDQSTSVSVAKAELGDPAFEITQGAETALRYGFWLLQFRRDRLVQRIRQHKPDPRAPHRYGDGPAIDNTILMLHRGMSIAEVESKVGSPEAFEEFFEGGPRPEVVLRYGLWEMAFNRGRLTARTKG